MQLLAVSPRVVVVAVVVVALPPVWPRSQAVRHLSLLLLLLYLLWQEKRRKRRLAEIPLAGFGWRAAEADLLPGVTAIVAVAVAVEVTLRSEK